MKIRIIFFVIGTVFVLGVGGIAYMQNNTKRSIELTVNPSKSTYLLGETISLDVSVKNVGAEDVRIYGELKSGNKTFDVSISKNNKDYKKYVPNKFKQMDGKPNSTVLSPNESISSPLTMLWNQKPSTSGTLAPDVLAQLADGKITTDYVFSEAGDYYVKASYLMNGVSPVLIESDPVMITIVEPMGEDLKAWNKIKENGDFAYLIQEGKIRIPLYRSAERIEFLQAVEQIIAEYPNSFYAENLRQSLVKFNALELKREKSLEKIQKLKEKSQ